jgi:hypothetical protein
VHGQIGTRHNLAMHLGRLAAVVLAVTAVIAPTAWQAPSHGQEPAKVRFHHAHYRVADPAEAMADAVRKLGGVWVILQGFGVGVRAGREFLLFDRAVPEGGALRHHAFTAYERVASRLHAWGLKAEPARPSDVRVLTALPDQPVLHLAFVADDLDAIVQRAVGAGAIVVSRRDDAVLFDAGDGLAIEIMREIDREETYWCPMHPDVRSADPGTCPVCAMALVPIPPPRIGEYKLDVSQVRAASGGTRGLEFAVRGPETGALVTDFTLVHERRFHLFVVGRDLQYFAHVHPELASDGRLRLDHQLPSGEFMLIADFMPAGGTSQMVQKAIIVTDGPAHAPRDDGPNGLVVRMDARDLGAGRHAQFTFTVSDGTTGADVTDLEPYLGAPAHMLIVRRDLSDAIHAHPDEQATSGPTVSFHPIIPAAGDYKLWIQFQRAGKVSTTTFEFTAR